jgi:hypothetical protein
MPMDIQLLNLNKHTNVAWLNQFMGYQLPLLIRAKNYRSFHPESTPIEVKWFIFIQTNCIQQFY